MSGTVASAEITVTLRPVAEGLTAPRQLISPPDGTKRRFIVEQIGLITILMPDGKVLAEPFLNIRHKIIRQMPDFDERGGPLRGDADLGKKLWYSHTNYVCEFKVSKDATNGFRGMPPWKDFSVEQRKAVSAFVLSPEFTSR